MIKPNSKLTTLFIALTLSCTAWSDSTQVQCIHKSDSEDRHMLIDQSGQSVTLKGKWQRLPVREGLSRTTRLMSFIFKLDKLEKNRLSCGTDYFTQTTHTTQSGLFLFGYNKQPNDSCYLSGYMSVFTSDLAPYHQILVESNCQNE